jgi:hypothetical protein
MNKLCLLGACLTLVACSEEEWSVDCEAEYQQSLANQCVSLDYFRAYACEKNEMGDGECFLDCVQGLTDGEDLCYDVEETCYAKCWDDDASGCSNGFNGDPAWRFECIEYRDFYRKVCDGRLDAATTACGWDCFENAGDTPDCQGLLACLDGCQP